MRDLGTSCDRCSQDRRDRDEDRADRQETWNQAKNLIKNETWPDEYEATPEDVLRLARYLAGESSD